MLFFFLLSLQIRKGNVSPKSSAKAAPTIPITNGVLDLRTRRESHGSESTATIDVSEEEKENRLMDEPTEHEDIVCAPSIPSMLSASSTCSSPSPSPPVSISPPLPRPPALPSMAVPKPAARSPNSVKCAPAATKSIKKFANGTVQHQNAKIVVESAAAAADVVASGAGIGVDRNGNPTQFNLTEMLLAAASQNPETLKELQFTPELIPHLSAIQQMAAANSKRGTTMNPIANLPILLPPVSSVGTRHLPDLLNPTILPLLTSELAMRLATGNVQPSVSPYVRQGKLRYSFSA